MNSVKRMSAEPRFFSYHLETDASLNTSRVENGLAFPGAGVVLRDPELNLLVARAVELGYLDPRHPFRVLIMGEPDEIPRCSVKRHLTG
jgi:hypothetical protein